MKPGRLLQPDDWALTQFNGRTQKVRIVARRVGVSVSQSGIQYRTAPALHPKDDGNPWAEDPPWIDADWFVPAEIQGDLF